jgi:acetyl-CoA carboxylase biotin carboxylase subunit
MPGTRGSIRYVYSGYTIPPNYDSMIAKLITTAQSARKQLDEEEP